MIIKPKRHWLFEWRFDFGKGKGNEEQQKWHHDRPRPNIGLDIDYIGRESDLVEERKY
jgi:hypothetical protein